jgi:integrase
LVNPFLYAKQFKRSRADLEQEYLENAVRNPIENTSLELGCLLDLIWQRRARNRKASDYLLTTLLLGARKSETGCLVWADRIAKQDWPKHSLVDLSAKVVRFAKTKTNTSHTLPMGKFLTWLMQERYRDNPYEIYVFPSDSKNPATKVPYYSSPREFVAELVKTLSVPEKEIAYQKAWATEQKRLKKAKLPAGKTVERNFRTVFEQQYVSPSKFTMHDLRRTFATAIATLESVPYAILKKLLNHSMRGDITGLYIDADSPEKLRKYMQLCENELLKHSTLIPKK